MFTSPSTDRWMVYGAIRDTDYHAWHPSRRSGRIFQSNYVSTQTIGKTCFDNNIHAATALKSMIRTLHKSRGENEGTDQLLTLVQRAADNPEMATVQLLSQLVSVFGPNETDGSMKYEATTMEDHFVFHKRTERLKFTTPAVAMTLRMLSPDNVTAIYPVIIKEPPSATAH